MDRIELQELHYITPIANLPSILRRGLLSHRRAEEFNPTSIALQDVQDRRESKRVPGGRALHDYVNLYICARNPMLYRRLDQRREICVLAVSPNVLDLQGVVVTDQNAASEYVRFSAGPAGLAVVDRARTFAEYWTDPDPVEQWRRKAAKCAEVLVPDMAAPRFIQAAYVCGIVPTQAIAALGLNLRVAVNRALYFNNG